MILLLTTGRSGSSMIAKIFHDHGVWFGECRGPDMFNETGYYENKRIKASILQTYGRTWDQYPPPKEKPGFSRDVYDVLEKEDYAQGRWCVKTGGLYMNCFDSFNPFKIAVRRPIDDVISSYKKTKWISSADDKREGIIRHLDGLLDAIPYQIQAEDIWSGNFNVLKNIFSHCGLEFREDIANGIIDGNLQHK